MMDFRGELKGNDIITYAMAGNARITIFNPKTEGRFTYRIKQPKEADGHRANIWFVSVLTGEDNESAYTYIGFIRGGVFVHGVKSRIGKDAPSVRSFQWFWARSPNNLAGVQVFHEGHCGRCGRALTVPESIATGLGPECSALAGVPRVKLAKTTPDSVEGNERLMQQMEAQGDREQTERENEAKWAAKKAMEGGR